MEDNKALTAADRAEALFLRGFNCSQSVYGAVHEALGMSEEQALRISAMLGGGICRTRKSCGAMLGALLAAGTVNGNVTGSADNKHADYLRGREMIAKFETEFGSSICADILHLTPEDIADESAAPAPRTAHYYDTRPCIACIRFAAALAEEYLMQYGDEK